MIMYGYGERDTTATYRHEDWTASVWHVRTDPDGRDVYAWVVMDDDRTVIAHDRDHDYVSTGRQGGDAREALSALVSFLSADGEAYGGAMRRREAPDPGQEWIFDIAVAEWSYDQADALAMAACEIDDDDEDED